VDQQLVNIMFSLVRYELGDCGPLLNEERIFVSNNIESLYKLSKAHDLSHIVWDSLTKQGITVEESEWSRKFEKERLLAMFRYERINYEFCELCSIFEEEKIPFIPLKGAVIRNYYPQPWMRTSCDIDILVNEEDLEKAVNVLKTKMEYKEESGRNHHDLSLYSPNGVHLELHFSIMGHIESVNSLLSKAWDHAVLVDGKNYQHKYTNEYFVFYHIAHMANHFINGGCGIKPFLDLLLIKRHIQFDSETVMKMCESCGLQKFYGSVLDLSKVWFENYEYSDITLDMQSFILFGGVYGNMKNGIAVKQSKRGGKWSYIRSRIFLNKKSLTNYYPILNKKAWLMPFCQVHRWFKIFVGGRFKRSINEIKVNSSISNEQTEQTRIFLNSIGL